MNIQDSVSNINEKGRNYFICEPSKVYKRNKNINDFLISKTHTNIDFGVVDSFGEEWSKFKDFESDEINRIGDEYFDILPASILNLKTVVLDMGCGTGRWTKYLADKVGFVEAVDPSKAIFVADQLLKECPNVRLSKASSDFLPFDDEVFDLVISVGVLHHIPDTLQAMKDCVRKVKKGGFFYTYLYYNLENRGKMFKLLFFLADKLRRVVSKLPSHLKKFICDLLAIILYMPFVIMSRILFSIGLTKISNKVPLSYYRTKSFFVIRNDALDRFGTSLEQRFSKKEIEKMMHSCGLTNITFSTKEPYWHVIGQKE